MAQVATKRTQTKSMDLSGAASQCPGHAETPDALLDAFIRLMTFQSTVWEVTRKVFHTDTRWLHIMSRASIMDLTAPNLFAVLGRACELATLMGIASLLDDIEYGNRSRTATRSSSGSHSDRRNLVLERVIDELGPGAETPERKRIDTDFRRAKALGKTILESRNKLGAHNDLRACLSIAAHDRAGSDYPLAKTTVGQIEKIMRRFDRIAEAIIKHRNPAGQTRNSPKVEVDEFFAALRRGMLFRNSARAEGAR